MFTVGAILVVSVAIASLVIAEMLSHENAILRRENHDLRERLAKAVEAMGEIGEVD